MSGRKCYLSPINTDDYPVYTKWMNDLEVTEGLGNYMYNFCLNYEREVLEKLAKEQNYAIIDPVKDEVIGNCGFYKINTMKGTLSAGYL